jgi:hypothetical protein
VPTEQNKAVNSEQGLSKFEIIMSVGLALGILLLIGLIIMAIIFFKRNRGGYQPIPDK